MTSLEGFLTGGPPRGLKAASDGGGADTLRPRYSVKRPIPRLGPRIGWSEPVNRKRLRRVVSPVCVLLGLVAMAYVSPAPARADQWNGGRRFDRTLLIVLENRNYG